MTHAAAIYLRYAKVEIGELYAARTTLESDIVRLACERLDAEGEVALRVVIEQEQAAHTDDIIGHTKTLHIALAEIAGNRALTLFLDTLISLSDEYSRPELAKADPELEARMGDSHRAHIAIAKAVLARDPDAASRRMRAHLAAVGKWMPRP